ncbi:uncharacterized protein LOC144214882 [Stigmatopora nigra]
MSQLLLLLLYLPLANCLTCYTCVFPAISPMDCLKFPEVCAEGHRCLSSTATARRGALQITLYEKSCAVPSQCGVSGQKYASGLYFNYTNVCCDLNLCNGALLLGANWGGAMLCLIPMVIFLMS